MALPPLETQELVLWANPAHCAPGVSKLQPIGQILPCVHFGISSIMGPEVTNSPSGTFPVLLLEQVGT